MSLGYERQRERHGHPHHDEVQDRSIASAVKEIDGLHTDLAAAQARAAAAEEDQVRLRAALTRKADITAELRARLESIDLAPVGYIAAPPPQHLHEWDGYVYTDQRHAESELADAWARGGASDWEVYEIHPLRPRKLQPAKPNE